MMKERSGRDKDDEGKKWERGHDKEKRRKKKHKGEKI